MNTSIFFSISLLTIATATSLISASPAFAQQLDQGPSRLPASGYCAGETVQISGWEKDLVRRNKGLEKFHWSAINTVNHYQVVSPVVAQKTPASARPTTAYHNVKPTVTGTWASLKPLERDKTCIASADNPSHSNTNTSAQLHSPSGYATLQMAHSYSANYGNQQAQYGGERSTDNRVSGRLMHY
jgi:hypothetical protein